MGRDVRFEDVLKNRWRTVKLFYWRRVGDSMMLVCMKCERERDNDPARANRFHPVKDGDSIWHMCVGCGARERVK